MKGLLLVIMRKTWMRFMPAWNVWEANLRLILPQRSLPVCDKAAKFILTHAGACGVTNARIPTRVCLYANGERGMANKLSKNLPVLMLL
jgi:hypothetical protein